MMQERILDECFRNIVASRPELEGKLDRTQRLMEEAVPDALVSGYEALAGTLTLSGEEGIPTESNRRTWRRKYAPRT